MKGASVFVALMAVGAACAVSPPVWPGLYKAEATITLPYAGITEPTVTYYDGPAQRQRIEYYDGMDTYIYRGDISESWQLNPEIDEMKCFGTKGPVQLTSLLPDLSNFKYMGTTRIGELDAQQFQYVVVDGGKTNTYNFFYDAAEQVPVQYNWIGYDTLLGSHFDHYIVDYVSFSKVTSFNESTFAHPDMTCGGFPGPGFENPQQQLAAMFPPASSTPAEGGNKAFNEFLATHGRAYDAAEYARRASLFVDNMNLVHAGNRKARAERRSMRMRVNFLADATKEEMAARAGGVGTRARNGYATAPRDVYPGHTHPEPAPATPLPGKVDWRLKGAVTPVKDQGICGSCWSFGTAETIEGTHFLATGDLTPLSQQELMDCSWNFGNNACDGGESWRAYSWILQNGGLADATSYGHYLMADGWCHANTTANHVSIKSYANVTSQSETALMDALADRGPIAIAIDASLTSFSFYSSGVYYDSACKSDMNSLDHAVLAVGYGTSDSEEDYWIVKNSWSTHWGNDGYILMSRKDNNCGVATDATYAIVA